MVTTIREGLTYDDVLLVPKHSTIQSRSTIDTSVDLGRGITIRIPIIPANMRSVCGEEMCKTFSDLGGLSFLHRFMPIDEMVRTFSGLEKDLVGCSVGVKEEEYERAKAVIAAGCKIICVDVAHGDHELCEKMVRHLRTTYPNILLIAGNVATAQGAMRLARAGADVIKVGVGPGSLCTTRIETGNGVPQLTALMDVHAARGSLDFRIIADGGLKNAGDIVKALCFAEAVMVGNVLAGTIETPGPIITVDALQYKQYEGSSTHKANHKEGVSAITPLKGPVRPVIERLLEGIRSGCSYQGVTSILDLQKDPEFVRISNAGLVESKPHLILR